MMSWVVPAGVVDGCIVEVGHTIPCMRHLEIDILQFHQTFPAPKASIDFLVAIPTDQMMDFRQHEKSFFDLGGYSS